MRRNEQQTMSLRVNHSRTIGGACLILAACGLALVANGALASPQELVVTPDKLGPENL